MTRNLKHRTWHRTFESKRCELNTDYEYISKHVVWADRGNDWGRQTEQIYNHSYIIHRLGSARTGMMLWHKVDCDYKVINSRSSLELPEL